jgi:hypothetical protein
MRAWLHWFRGLSGPARWGIVGTILSGIGLIVGLVGLVPAFSAGGASNPSVHQLHSPAQGKSEQAEASEPKTNTTGSDSPIQQAKGNDNIQIGSARDVIFNRKPKTRKREVLQNPGSPVVLVLKEIDEDPKLYFEYVPENDKHLGWVPVGIEVKSLEEKRKIKGNDLVGMGSYTKVEILEGEYKGKSGWVPLSKIKPEVVPE